MDDNSRPHRFPPAALDAGWLIGWECQACGAWIREYGPYEPGECSVDWRAPVSEKPSPNASASTT